MTTDEDMTADEFDRLSAAGTPVEVDVQLNRDAPPYKGPHGYGGYSAGCRCDSCRIGKRNYMRAKRKTAARTQRAAADPDTYVAPGITHGTYSGYTDSYCRCAACLNAKATRGQVAS